MNTEHTYFDALITLRVFDKPFYLLNFVSKNKNAFSPLDVIYEK